MVCIIRVSAVLADEFGSTEPTVRVDVPADGTFLRTILGRNREDQLSLTEGFIAREGDDLAPPGGQDHPDEARLRFSAVRQKPAWASRFAFGRHRSPYKDGIIPIALAFRTDYEYSND